MIKPFENEEETFNIDELTIENRVDRVQIYGSVELTRDKTGLQRALELKLLVDAVVATLQAENLPDAITMEAPDVVDNPFK